MKITRKLLEQYIRKVMKESWHSRYRNKEREREMNIGTGARHGAQSDWYAPKSDYQPRQSENPKTNMEKALRIHKGGTNARMLQGIANKAEQMASSVVDEATRNAAVETMAEELAAQFSNNFSRITKDSLLKTKGRVIEAVLDAAIKDAQGTTPEPYGS